MIIIFRLTDLVQGSPILVEENNDCSYMFLWESKHGCPITPPDNNCAIDTSKGRIDLTPLRRNEAGKNYDVTDGKSGGKMLMNLCGTLAPTGHSECQDVSLCLPPSNTGGKAKVVGVKGLLQENST
jgi:hypothetical protein